MHLGRLAGWGHRDGQREMHVDFTVRRADFERANLVMLQHIEVVDHWLGEHKSVIAKKYSDLGQPRTEGEIIREHNSTFARWFKALLLNNSLPMTSTKDQLIFALSQGPAHNLKTYQSYDING